MACLSSGDSYPSEGRWIMRKGVLLQGLFLLAVVGTAIAGAVGNGFIWP
jgi:hypothetical protein